MILWSVSATIIAGKEAEGEEWLKHFAQFVHERFGTAIQLAQRMDGSGGRYLYFEKHDSLAAWEAENNSFGADAEAVAKWRESRAFFTDFEFHFWQTL